MTQPPVALSLKTVVGNQRELGLVFFQIEFTRYWFVMISDDFFSPRLSIADRPLQARLDRLCHRTKSLLQ